MGRYIGLEIGGTKLQAVIGDEQGHIYYRTYRPARSSLGAEAILHDILVMVQQSLQLTEIDAIGVGFGGPIDIRTGQVACSHQVAGWNGFPLKQWLQERFHRKVRVENDANTAALAEALCGAGTDSRVVFYVTLGSGVGGGLVVDGQIYHGAIPGEAEIGHVRLSPNGPTVEERCSGWAIDNRIREGIGKHTDSLLARLAKEDPGHEARHLRPALEKKDPWALLILNELADDLAFALSHVVHLIHPDCIILGGGLAQLGPFLTGAVNQRLPGLVMKAFHPPPPIKLSALGQDVVPVGAVLLAAGRG